MISGVLKEFRKMMIGLLHFTIPIFLCNQDLYPNDVANSERKDARPNLRWQMRKQLASEHSICYWLWGYVGVPFQTCHTNNGETMRELLHLLGYWGQS